MQIMSYARRKFIRFFKCVVISFLVYCVTWIGLITEWNIYLSRTIIKPNKVIYYDTSATTMKTIIAYSERKLAEMNRPTPLTCDQIPEFPEVPYFNRTWSPEMKHLSESLWQRVPGTNISLYTAYYDGRVDGQPYIRILGRFSGRTLANQPQLYCQTRSLNQIQMDVEVVTAVPTEIWWHEWDTLSTDIETPLLLSCALTDVILGDYVVSVVLEPCDNPEVALEVYNYDTEILYERNFTVCVKDMTFTDNKTNLVEWIEFNKLIGAEAIDIYVDKVTDEIKNIIEYYRSKEFVRLFQAPISKGKRHLWQRRRDHIISYNDCLYRNMRESKYIIPLDIDEIIVPKLVNNWSDLIEMLPSHGWNEEQHSSILIKNVFFFYFLQKKTLEHKDSDNYIKRDNVRLDLKNETDSINNFNIVIDNKKELKEYKQRCHRDKPESRFVNSIIRSSIVSPTGHYSKSIMLTKRVLTVFNHYPLSSLGVNNIAIWTAPFNYVQMNHYKEHCTTSVIWECQRYTQNTAVDTTVRRLENALIESLYRAPCY